MFSSILEFTYDPIGPAFLNCLYREIEFASIRALFLGPATYLDLSVHTFQANEEILVIIHIRIHNYTHSKYMCKQGFA